ncbi:uncharacterized protein LOC114538036 [Dendronephthya gigantea]|uniref:uncharacterized protein LOC114538036 n=1 Tax=Dendronephthya gigantea TaxID=151771 RepID=UPI00106AE7CF|nr:uncharacterized protein LOC114538036 [Dendronephthya gigantea]
MACYNLLRGDSDNPLFDVTFDFYSPRPHFIILTKAGVPMKHEFGLISSEQIQQLIKAGNSVLEIFKIAGGTLSIHRGAWRSEANKVHVHFPVDLESYLRVFESLKGDIPNWPSKKYVTKEWKKSKNPRSYVENVRGYPYRCYLADDVKSVTAILSCEQDVALAELPLEGGIKKIVYHSSHPKIGFVGKKPASIEEFQQVLSAMENIAKDLRLTDMKSKNAEKHGCHVCLYLGSVSSAGWNGLTKEDDEDVVGHIVMSGFRFYQLCPVELRENWFHAYEQSGFQCLT